MHGEGYYRRTAGAGHGAQAGVAVVDEHVSGRRRWGPGASRGTFPSKMCSNSWDTVSSALGSCLRVQTERCAKAWPVGGEKDTVTGRTECL